MIPPDQYGHQIAYKSYLLGISNLRNGEYCIFSKQNKLLITFIKILKYDGMEIRHVTTLS